MAKIIECTQDAVKKAAKALKDGHLVAFPTETVYGLGADASNEKAVSRIYSVKGRPTNHPLIVHISSFNKLGNWAIDVPNYAIKLAKEFWPGPMTLILKRNYSAKDFITGGQDYVGVRVPSHPIASELLNEFERIGGVGVVAPSANRFGAVSCTTSQSVYEELKEFLNSDDSIIRAEQCLIGIESTIIDCTNQAPIILRPGAVTSDLIHHSTGKKPDLTSSKSNKEVSGTLKSHYAPKAKIVLNSLPEFGEGFIAMADIPTPKGAIRLSSPTDVEMYAKELYESFRLADRKNIKVVKVMMPSGQGLALAIRDRLAKASY